MVRKQNLNHDKGDKADAGNNKERDDATIGPGVLCTAPSKSSEKTNDTAEKHNASWAIEAKELFFEGKASSCAVGDLEKKCKKRGGDSSDG
jgi:hypothetical protein